MKCVGVMREDLLPRQTIHRFLGAEDRPPERMIRPERCHENLVHQVVRCVLDHLDLFEDDRALRFEANSRARPTERKEGSRSGSSRRMEVRAGRRPAWGSWPSSDCTEPATSGRYCQILTAAASRAARSC